jgi:hypothetical protein
MQDMLLKEPQNWKNMLTSIFGFNTNSIAYEKNKVLKNPTILLIDEVDVFFDTNFFGQSYCPAIPLRGKEIEALLRFIWRGYK